ncbi:MAG TPA: molybdopterin-synthase adenylyltransferase MoeB [Vicinamibacterales bacterium]|nr:molybdopterin-synthase adenylyltransferase MoeB [Vicinamibacterales bacterium]
MAKTVENTPVPRTPEPRTPEPGTPEPGTPEPGTRYDRQIRLAGFGEAGQRKLAAARVLVVGAGGLGSPASMYLAAAGIGTIDLVDFDRVDESNLHRQLLYGTPDIGRQKIDAAAGRLRAINPHTRVVAHDAPFSADNARALVVDADVVIDGTDNFSTRYLVNDACVMAKTPNVYGSVAQFDGQLAVFAVSGGPCYRCLHPEPPPAGLIDNCAEGGVLGVLPGVIGTLQATEAIKLITGIGEPLVGRLLLYDALKMRTRQIVLPRDPACPVCGDAPSIQTLVEYDRVCAPTPATVGAIRVDLSPSDLAAWREDGVPHMLVDVREPSEHAAASIEGAVLIPSGLLDENLSLLPKDRPVVVHCQSGGRSSRAVAKLRAIGYDARNLEGGIRAWKLAASAKSTLK